jgi:transcriptional regulator with XRE-family HTH domain
MVTLNDRLRTAREQAGLSQGQVARQLNKSRPTITQIESGKRRVTAGELAEFAKLYEVSMMWLSGTNEDDNETTSRVQLAARNLAQLRPQDLDKVLDLLHAMRRR